MLKLIVLVVSMALLSATLAEKITKEEIEFRGSESAKWATDKLAAFLKQPGQYYLQKFSNLNYKLGETTQFLMTLDISVTDANKQASFKRCDVDISDTAITNTRILNRVKCTENTSF